MEEKDIFKFITDHLTFEMLPKTKEVLWYINDESAQYQSQFDVFFNHIDGIDHWDLVLKLLQDQQDQS